MRYHVSCHLCSGIDAKQFTITVSPSNEGVYEVTCPKGHSFRIDVLSHHFQKLFENGIHALSDQYFIESFVSFVTCYERFIEYFLNIIFLSKGTPHTVFKEGWKELAKQSERQLGAFILIHLQEFGKKAILINPELRNKVIHQGYLPTEQDCIKFGNGVLNFIRPIISAMKSNRIFEDEMLRSVNNTGYFEDREITVHYMPYQLFAINRPFDQTDDKSIEDFLKDQGEIKNRA